jgi:hypothetical protein
VTRRSGTHQQQTDQGRGPSTRHAEIPCNFQLPVPNPKHWSLTLLDRTSQPRRRLALARRRERPCCREPDRAEFRGQPEAGEMCQPADERQPRKSSSLLSLSLSSLQLNTSAGDPSCVVLVQAYYDRHYLYTDSFVYPLSIRRHIHNCTACPIFNQLVVAELDKLFPL